MRGKPTDRNRHRIRKALRRLLHLKVFDASDDVQIVTPKRKR